MAVIVKSVGSGRCESLEIKYLNSRGGDGGICIVAVNGYRRSLAISSYNSLVIITDWDDWFFEWSTYDQHT